MFYLDYLGGPIVSFDPCSNDANQDLFVQLVVSCLARNGRLRIFRKGVHVETHTLADALRYKEPACESTTSQQAAA